MTSWRYFKQGDSTRYVVVLDTGKPNAPEVAYIPGTSKNAEPNARLIAAAPATLAALEELVAVFTAGIDADDTSFDAVIARARAAIAAAK